MKSVDPSREFTMAIHDLVRENPFSNIVNNPANTSYWYDGIWNKRFLDTSKPGTQSYERWHRTWGDIILAAEEVLRG